MDRREGGVYPNHSTAARPLQAAVLPFARRAFIIQEKADRSRGRPGKGRRLKMRAEIFGADICTDCVALKDWLARHPGDWTWAEITADTATLKRFLALRDTDPAFAPVRQGHTIGIPCYLFADGTVLLDGEQARAKLQG